MHVRGVVGPTVTGKLTASDSWLGTSQGEERVHVGEAGDAGRLPSRRRAKELGSRRRRAELQVWWPLGAAGHAGQARLYTKPSPCPTLPGFMHPKACLPSFPRPVTCTEGEQPITSCRHKCTQDEGVSEVPLPWNQGRLPWVEGVSCRAFVGWPERRGIPPAPVQWSALLGA